MPAYDVAVVGDTQRGPTRRSSRVSAHGRGSLDERLHAAVSLTADVLERSALVWRAIVEASVADSEVAEWRDNFPAGRHVEIRHAGSRSCSARHLDPATADLLWAVLGSEVYLKLVHERGETRAEYEALMVRAVRDPRVVTG